MQVVTLKAFNYSPDGSTLVGKDVDDEFECRDDIVDGLIDEGFVRPASAEAEARRNKAKSKATKAAADASVGQ